MPDNCNLQWIYLLATSRLSRLTFLSCNLCPQYVLPFPDVLTSQRNLRPPIYTISIVSLHNIVENIGKPRSLIMLEVSMGRENMNIIICKLLL